ncbi:MAG: adenine phosphoribosyltransferase Apt [Idiomarinaceae bacterium HL-53]|nr:MAG: adenine phosphoribosyltransferase Apt [Idiomarinaceae bacterium HL-53]CUS49453.1 adenine phosphoribosyltransferase [Idiomarinaceae bacterium HL-53]
MTHYVCADLRSDYIQRAITNVHDFPRPGVVFRDITTALADPKALRYSIDLFHERYENSGLTQIVAVEARGFIFAAALADRLGVGLTLIRKAGKLPRDCHHESYELEYGNDALELHKDSLHRRDRVVVMDDLLATGGTIGAAIDLLKKTPATIVEAAFLAELLYLPGRRVLAQKGVSSYAVVAYDDIK